MRDDRATTPTRDDDGETFERRRDDDARRRRATATGPRESGAEALTIERARLANAVERLERSCEALEEAAADDATTATDKETYARALRENARAISRHQGEIYALTVEIERIGGAKAWEGDASAREGRWV